MISRCQFPNRGFGIPDVVIAKELWIQSQMDFEFHEFLVQKNTHVVIAAGSGTPPLARRPAAAAAPVVGLVIGQQVLGVSPAMQRAQDEAEIRTLTAQVRRVGLPLIPLIPMPYRPTAAENFV